MLDSFKNSNSLFALKKPTAANKAGVIVLFANPFCNTVIVIRMTIFYYFDKIFRSSRAHFVDTR